MTHGMGTILRFRWLGCWLSIALCHASLTTGAVRASCGDYVTVGGITVGGRTASVPHESEHERSLAALDHAVAPTSGLPCGGPHCSRRQQAPEESPAPVLSVAGHEWLVADEASEFEPPAPLGVVSLSHEPCSFLWATGIFRPPRHLHLPRHFAGRP